MVSEDKREIKGFFHHRILIQREESDEEDYRKNIVVPQQWNTDNGSYYGYPRRLDGSFT